MLSEEFIQWSCLNNGYDWFRAMEECMGYVEEIFSGEDLKEARKHIRARITDIINQHTPYTRYGLENISINHDDMCDMVRKDKSAALKNCKPFNKNNVRVDYATLREALQGKMHKLKRRIQRSDQMNSSEKALFEGYKFSVKVNHVILLAKESCSCYICGSNVEMVTFSENEHSPEYVNMSFWTKENNTGEWVQMTVDHKEARGLGGSSWYDNMAPACSSCNNKKSAIESKIANHNHNVKGVLDATLYPFQCRFVS